MVHGFSDPVLGALNDGRNVYPLVRAALRVDKCTERVLQFVLQYMV